ncbi:MAG: tetratricopeptide repeat protein [Bacteroidota bacterium]|nr:tetratricopeptide repeat protein [Candidatus Kapabacteria bacterium]MCS7302052.1 tetratricopeptide repeat protein [Candidatus Kapabacteria bacterium]MCX7936852.1 tetratricopeptide repeat protein [Chlorobiota bacterium]MDW8074571.1 tetratricopeptide repeat protein [Bacteroidota bacterium]MDW8270953.1 tetratricopeptide repeat protein [Bacteroidota bacterium]
MALTKQGVWIFVLLYLVAHGVSGAPRDSLIRVVQLSTRELLLISTAKQTRYREDFTTSPKRIRLELEGLRCADSIREIVFPQTIPPSTVFARQHSSGSVVIVDFAEPVGHVLTELPYSHALYIRTVNWDNAGECSLAWGIAAWANNQYSRALQFWRVALSQGVTEASLWLGIAEALQQNYARALDYLEQPLKQIPNPIPDAYAAAWHAYTAQLNRQRATDYEQRYMRTIGRPPTLPPFLQITADSTGVTPSLLEFVEYFSPPPMTTAAPEQSSTSITPADSDIFGQLRRMQQRNDANMTSSNTYSPPSSPIFTVLFAVGTVLLISGVILVRGYYRWRKQQIAQLAAGIATAATSHATSKSTVGEGDTPIPPFDELMKIADLNHHGTKQDTHPPAFASSGKKGTTQSVGKSLAPDDSAQYSSEESLFDFDEETYRQFEQRLTTESQPKIDEQLLYQSSTRSQLSHEPPEQTARELSAQERDLLELLEQLSKQYGTTDEAEES